MSEQDVDKLKRLVKSLDDCVEVVEKMLADGKIDFSDAQHVMGLSAPLKDLYDLWSHKDEMIAEAKDVDWDELIELVGAAKE